MSGKVIKSGTLSNQNSVDIKLDELSPSMYIFRLQTTKGEQYTEKLIITE